MKDIIKFLVYAGLFAVPCLTLYVANSFFFPYITGKNFAFRIIVEAVAGLWLVLCLFDKNYRPRFSWLLVSFSALIGVMAVATLQAESVNTALWSNFERMDGYITLIHVYTYFVVLGAMMKSKTAWMAFFHGSVLVAFFVAFGGLVQLSQATGVRVDSSLGNAAYMAVYMLFHIFLLAYLFSQTKVVPYRLVYAVLIALFVFVLLQTGTRGTAIGLAFGSLVSVAYVALFAVKYPQVRRYAAGALAALALVLGIFYVARDTAYVQSSPSLARVANIDLGNDLAIRKIIWGMSVEGIKERPVLGWGNGNFNFVFNDQFDPRLYNQEQWFDRVHDIFFDWLIAGGIVGFVAYFSIFAAALYYLIVRPLFAKTEEFTLIERGILLGLLLGYLTHNIVVFDNIVSYIFFAVTLAFIHSRVGSEMLKVQSVSIPTPIVTQILAPAIIAVTLVVVYVVNVPNIQAARIIITALQVKEPATQLEIFKKALALNSFGEQEIIEQLAQQAMSLAQAGAQSTVDPKVKAEYLKVAEEKLIEAMAKKLGDARLEVFLASFYRSTSQNDKAEKLLAQARTHSERKQSIIIQQGAVALALGKNEEAEGFFKEAYELDTNYAEAEQYYIAALISNKKVVEAKKMIANGGDELLTRLSTNDFVLSALNGVGEYGLMADFYEKRLAADPSVAQNWASLAFMYYEQSKATSTPVTNRPQFTGKAIDTLERGAAAVPTFKPTAACVIANIKANRTPDQGCTTAS